MSVLQEKIDEIQKHIYAVKEMAAYDLIAVSHIPDFDIYSAAVCVHDLGNIGGVLMGRCYATYNGEKVGPDRTWAIRLVTK